MRQLAFLLVLLAAVPLAGCGSFPYKVEVPQGNIVTEEMIDTLQPGMTKRQVRFVLGTPSLADAFHPDRWDYIYSVARSGEERAHRKITLVFEGDVLQRIEGDLKGDQKAEFAQDAAPPRL